MTESKFTNFKHDEFLIQHDISWKCHESDGHVEYALNCPMCVENGLDKPDRKHKLWVNFQDGTFYCYRCAWTGGLPRLIGGLLNTTDYMQIFKILKGDPLDQLEFMNLPLQQKDFVPFGEEDGLREIDLPHGYEPIDGPNDYLEYRGVPWEYARDKMWGISHIGYTKNRIIVPTFMNGKIVFWQARATWEEKSDEFKKVLNPTGVSARSVLYNFDEAKEHSSIVLVEGFMDSVKAGSNSMATNGKNLHTQQVDWLLKTKAKEITILWDADAWTDHKETKDKYKRSSIHRAVDLLRSYSFVVKAVKLPPGIDPGTFQFESAKLRTIINMAKEPKFSIPKGKKIL